MFPIPIVAAAESGALKLPGGAQRVSFGALKWLSAPMSVAVNYSRFLALNYSHCRRQKFC